MFRILKQSVKSHLYYILFLILTLGTYFSILFSKILYFKDDGIYAGHVNVWSDWALHIAIANIFAFKSPRYWFAYHPLYAGGKFTYPFMADMLSGFLMRLGLPLRPAFILPSVLMVLVLLTGLYFLMYLLTRSKKLAVVAVMIFFLAGGLGFIDFLRDAWQNHSFSFLPSNIMLDYGRHDNYQWYAGSMVDGLLLPQRAFLFGTALGVWAILGLFYVVSREDKLAKNIKTNILIVAGILAGILPVTHAHSFIAVMVTTGLLCFFNIKKWMLLWPYVAVAGVISSVLYLTFISGGIQSGSFIQNHLGYTSQGDFFDWLRMWTLLWGLMLPIVMLALFFFRKEIGTSGWALYAGAGALFVAGNIFYFQPIAWDNSKIFWWVYLLFCAPAAMILGKLWSGRNFILRATAVFIFTTLIFTGVVDLVGLIQIDKHSYQMTSAEDMKLGSEISQKTDPVAVFLTAPSHNHFIMIWGMRPILMGYTAWVWNFGFNYNQREADLKQMFLGGDNAPSLLKKYNISYVAIGPTELHDLNANEQYFKGNFPLAFKDNNYNIYDTRTVLGR